jgi:hypothetical protein
MRTFLRTSTRSGESRSSSRVGVVRRRVFVAAAAGVVMMSGAAYAYVASTGSGTGTASTGTMQTVTVNAFVGGDAPSTTLYPGGPAADVILRVNNPNAFSVRLYSVSGNGSITADAGHSGCTTPGVTFNPPSNPNITIPVGTSLVHLSGAASMSTASLNACQGATFSIPVSITVHSP